MKTKYEFFKTKFDSKELKIKNLYTEIVNLIDFAKKKINKEADKITMGNDIATQEERKKYRIKQGFNLINDFYLNFNRVDDVLKQQKVDIETYVEAISRTVKKYEPQVREDTFGETFFIQMNQLLEAAKEKLSISPPSR